MVGTRCCASWPTSRSALPGSWGGQGSADGAYSNTFFFFFLWCYSFSLGLADPTRSSRNLCGPEHPHAVVAVSEYGGSVIKREELSGRRGVFPAEPIPPAPGQGRARPGPGPTGESPDTLAIQAPHLAGFADQKGAVLPAGPGPGGRGAAGGGGPWTCGKRWIRMKHSAAGRRANGPASSRPASMAAMSEALPGAGEASWGMSPQTRGPPAGASGVIRPRGRRRGLLLAESTKGRALLEAMAQGARQQSRTEIPAELRQQEENLLNRLAALRTPSGRRP